MKLKLKINLDLNSKYKKGNIVFIEADKDGVPLELYWRKRLRDSVLDNCVEVVKEKKGGKK